MSTKLQFTPVLPYLNNNSFIRKKKTRGCQNELPSFRVDSKRVGTSAAAPLTEACRELTYLESESRDHSTPGITM